MIKKFGKNNHQGESKGLLRFGLFEVDPVKGELRKDGVKLHLSGQPLQILVLLLQRSGEVVTRDQLRHELWPENTFVDFDRCLNTAVNRVREVLNDSASNPRYIKTIPRRGYKFVAPVEQVGDPSAEERKSALPNRIAPKYAGRTIVWLLGLVVVAIVAVLLAWFRIPTAVRPLRFVTLNRLDGIPVTPSFSPDGNNLLFAWKRPDRSSYDLYVETLAKPEPVALTDNPADDFSPAYSPDGNQIAFYRRSGDRTEIWLLSTATRKERMLVELNIGSPAPVILPPEEWPGRGPTMLSWSPDGATLAAMYKDSPGGPFSIALLSVDTGEKQRVTWPEAGTVGDTTPAISPDGKMLAFVRRKLGPAGDIYLMRISGERPHRLTAENKIIQGMAWTSDSREIVFSSDYDGDPSVWRIPVTGGSPRLVAGLLSWAVFPSIDHRGHRLTFVRWTGNSRFQQVRLPHPVANISPPFKGFDLVNTLEFNPRYSHDGKRVAFTASIAGSEVAEIMVANADGRNPESVTHILVSSGSPRWSPDDHFIVFDSNVEGNRDIYTVRIADKVVRRLTRHSAVDNRPCWSADGQWVFFASDRSGTQQIWKVSATGGQPVAITRNGGGEPLASVDGKLIYYVKQGLPGLWSVPVQGGKERLVFQDLQVMNCRNWTVAPEGIYFLRRTLPPSPCGKTHLMLYRFRTRRIEHITSTGEAWVANSGCSLSPDRKWLLYVRRNHLKAAIMLVENFN